MITTVVKHQCDGGSRLDPWPSYKLYTCINILLVVVKLSITNKLEKWLCLSCNVKEKSVKIYQEWLGLGMLSTFNQQ